MMRRPQLRLLLISASISVLASCGGERAASDSAGVPDSTTVTGDARANAEVAGENNAAKITAETAALNAWFEEQWKARLDRSPQAKTSLGIRTDYDKWNNPSDAFAEESHALLMASLAEMRDRFDPNDLTPSAQLSYRLYEYRAEQAEKFAPYRNHWYRFSHFRGPHSGVPPFLINQHQVASVSDAEAYITRLNGVKDHLGAHQNVMESQFANGVHPPKWSYEKMILTSENIISGAPFDDSEIPSALMADIQKKITSLDTDETTKANLMARAETALTTSVKPAYESLIAMFETQADSASNDDGAWKLPDGETYYALQLQRMTTTAMTAEQIHELGLREVARIHDEMRVIKNNVGFDGDLTAFFSYMRDDPDERFSYPDTPEGRVQYLADATELIDNMRGRLGELFFTEPNADLTVKRVEAFREKAGSKAFYQRPAPDGSRPGIFYANLYDIAAMPTYQMEALAYHEGIPGHHMQIAIAQELENMPSFRKFGRQTAFSEGWGLYSEYIPKEMGLYEDPYSDFGRLAMELWRAARLVVDSGIHDKKWTREDATAYLVKNTPNPVFDCERAIERYVVMPGQATAYKVGMLKILELRQRAEDALGDNFDVRAFHDVVLKNGAIPLSILEENVDAWIEQSDQT